MPKLKLSPARKPLSAAKSKPQAPVPGTAQTEREVDFVFECPGVRQVCVCGDFNGWQPASLRLIGGAGGGLWATRITVPAGRHEYKFIVDGQWQHDPGAREYVPNVYGSINSVIEVGP
jgi:1,4-alpha-glucan branching enzyme